MDCQPGVIRTPGLFSTASFGGGRTIEKSCRKTLVSTLMKIVLASYKKLLQLSLTSLEFLRNDRKSHPKEHTVCRVARLPLLPKFLIWIFDGRKHNPVSVLILASLDVTCVFKLCFAIVNEGSWKIDSLRSKLYEFIYILRQRRKQALCTQIRIFGSLTGVTMNLRRTE